MSERFQRFANTDHLDRSLKRSTVRGAAATFGAQWSSLVLQVGSTAVLARLLEPDSFGLVAMVSSIVAIVLALKDSGLVDPVVQNQELTHEQCSWLFWANAALMGSLSVICLALAPLLQLIYGRSEVIGISVVFAALIAVSGISNVHRALMRRQMRLGELAIEQVVVFGLSIAGGIAAAAYGLGYWSLVIMQGIRMVGDAIWVATRCPWIPGLPLRGTGARGVLGSGAWFSASTVLSQAGRNADNVLLGIFQGAASLGQYTRAYALLLLPLQQISAPFARVAIPALAKAQGDRDRFQRAYFMMLFPLSFMVLPMTATLIVIAEPLTLVLLGPGWEEVPGIFRWLGFAALAQSITTTYSWIWIARGESRKFFRMNLVFNFSAICGFIIGSLHSGLMLAIIYSAVVVLIHFPFATFYGLRGTGIASQHVLKQLIAPTICAAICGGITMAVLAMTRDLAPILQCAISGIASCICLGTAIGIHTPLRLCVADFIRYINRR